MILPALSAVSSSRFTISGAPSYTLGDPDDLFTSDLSKWRIHNVSDPFIIFVDNYYYAFSTDFMTGNQAVYGTIPLSIQIRRSPDLIRWEWVGNALSALPSDATAHCGPSVVRAWAPHVEKIGSTFYLYYSASTFGTTNSFIGVLSSNSINGPWTNLGEVYKTNFGASENAIDPNIVKDKDNNRWMVYGSYANGIYVIRVDDSTGKILSGAPKTNICRRNASGFRAVEGAYIIYNADFDYYYLFISFGQCCFNDLTPPEPLYNVRVGRSASITGPYVDVDGQSLTDTVSSPSNAIGTKLMGGYKFGASIGWVAPGHNAIFQKGKDYFTVHHARLDNDFNWNYLHVRRVLWASNGWPMFMPQRYAGEFTQKIISAKVAGNYAHIEHTTTSDTQATSSAVALEDGGNVSIPGNANAGTWSLSGTNDMTLVLSGVTFECQVFSAWDWELETSAIVYTGMSATGTCVWGKKV
jgi:arabinan endo-1,5-alpha-L-arabinosidase